MSESGRRRARSAAEWKVLEKKPLLGSRTPGKGSQRSPKHGGGRSHRHGVRGTVRKGSGWRKLAGKHGPHAVQGAKEWSGRSRPDARPWRRERDSQPSPGRCQTGGRRAGQEHGRRVRRREEAAGGPRGRREDGRGLGRGARDGRSPREGRGASVCRGEARSTRVKHGAPGGAGSRVCCWRTRWAAGQGRRDTCAPGKGEGNEGTSCRGGVSRPRPRHPDVPDPVCSRKLSRVGPGRCLDGRPPRGPGAVGVNKQKARECKLTSSQQSVRSTKGRLS